MKTPKTYNYFCNVCEKEIVNRCKGRTLIRDEESSEWVEGDSDEWDDTETHICNACHVQLCWCFPGGKNNPT